MYFLTGTGFEQFLRRDAYNAALKEGPTPRLLVSRKIPCSSCEVLRNADSFPPEQLNREFSDRHCSASLRRIDICEHESVNLGEIKKLARDAARDFITLSTDSFSSSSARCVQYTCPHRAHVQSENWPSEMQQPSMTIKLDANGLPEEVTVHAHVFVSGMNTRRRHDYTSLACALETNNSAPSQECKHVAALPKYFCRSQRQKESDWFCFSLGCWSVKYTLTCFTGSVAGQCFDSDCTSRWCFTYHYKHLSPSRLIDVGPWTSLWLHLESCRMRLSPTVATDQAWLSCSRPPASTKVYPSVSPEVSRDEQPPSKSWEVASSGCSDTASKVSGSVVDSEDSSMPFQAVFGTRLLRSLPETPASEVCSKEKARRIYYARTTSPETLSLWPSKSMYLDVATTTQSSTPDQKTWPPLVELQDDTALYERLPSGRPGMVDASTTTYLHTRPIVKNTIRATNAIDPVNATNPTNTTETSPGNLSRLGRLTGMYEACEARWSKILRSFARQEHGHKLKMT